MYLSPESRTQTLAYLEHQQPALLDAIGAATLRLKFPGYTGTATLCKISRDGHNREMALIATSRRHLFSWWGLPEQDERRRPPLEDYRTREVLGSFLQACRLEYGDDRIATIDNLAGFGSDWSNDLLLLLSYDPHLLAYTKMHGFLGNAEKIRRYRMFMAGRDGSGGIDGTHYRCLQSGFGLTENGVIGTFRCRLVSLETPQPRWAVFANGVRHENALLCSASDCDTATSGDEGGPLYALAQYEDEPGQCFLLGFNLGVNGTAATAPKQPVRTLRDGIDRLGPGPARLAAAQASDAQATIALAEREAGNATGREPARFGTVPTVFNNVATAVKDVLDRSYMIYDHASGSRISKPRQGVTS